MNTTLKFLPLSDLHLEFYYLGEKVYMPGFTEVDRNELVVLLAGDIHKGTHAVDWIAKWADQVKAVCYICGNHEFYGQNLVSLPGKVRARIEELGLANVYYLDNETVTIDDTLIIGSTMWTDFDNGSGASMMAAEQWMTDYKKTSTKQGGRYRKAKALDTFEIHRRSREFLREALAKPHDGPKVVMTHHLPSHRFIDPQYKGEELNGAYASHLDELVDSGQADLWVYGHSHEAKLAVVNGTQFIINARGYPQPNELVTGFDDSMRIDLGDHRKLFPELLPSEFEP
jgi:predicted phosphohydrolase